MWRRVVDLKQPGNEIRCVVLLILYLLERRVPFSYASYPFKGIERYISEHIADKVNAETLAANFGYERSYFSRKFKSVFSLSPGEYIKIIRLSRAASLLKYGASIDSVCAQLGYADKKVFSRAFKAYTGVCPSKYEKNHKMQP